MAWRLKNTVVGLHWQSIQVVHTWDLDLHFPFQTTSKKAKNNVSVIETYVFLRHDADSRWMAYSVGHHIDFDTLFIFPSFHVNEMLQITLKLVDFFHKSDLFLQTLHLLQGCQRSSPLRFNLAKAENLAMGWGLYWETHACKVAS